MKRASRAIPFFLIAVLLSSPHLLAGGRRRAVAASPPSSDLSVTFLGSAGVLDAGTMSWRGGRKDATVTTRNVTMRIGPATAEARGTATVRAFLEMPDPLSSIRVNGVLLTGVPQIVQRQAPIGVTGTYRIEIAISTSAPDGPLQTSIGWEVSTD
jgi:hypothetical protein